MEENSEEISKKLEDLKQELQEQEGLRVSLEEKIKQLTKLILSSTNANPVGSTPAEAPAVMSRRQRSSTATPGLMQKYRSLTLTKTPSVTVILNLFEFFPMQKHFYLNWKYFLM